MGFFNNTFLHHNSMQPIHTVTSRMIPLPFSPTSGLHLGGIHSIRFEYSLITFSHCPSPSRTCMSDMETVLRSSPWESKVTFLESRGDGKIVNQQ